jgi:hypothetical protein
LGRSERKIQGLGMPERVLICWQLKSHWGSPQGKVHFTIWQCGVGNLGMDQCCPDTSTNPDINPDMHAVISGNWFFLNIHPYTYLA